MGKSPAFQFYPGDWIKDPALRACTVSARGIWFDMICFMHQSIRYGYFLAGNKIPTIEEAARMLGCSPIEFKDALVELERFDVFSRDDEGIIFSRRMLRDHKNRAEWAKRQRSHRTKKNELIKRVAKSHGNVTHNVTLKSPLSSSSSSLKDLKHLSDSVEIRLSKMLFDLIRTRNPSHKEPNYQAWARQIDLMIRVDHRDPTEIKKVIQACQADAFWQNNILSTEKLRAQYDQLVLKL